MKKKKLFIALALVLVVYLVYKGYERWPSQNWKEYGSLVKIWPRLKKEKIESIRFCQGEGQCNGTFFQEMVATFSFRIRDANVVKEWPSGYEVPKENLRECIKIIDKAMKNAQRPWWLGGNCWSICPLSKMLIVTSKGKYIVHVETNISDVDRSSVYGEEWNSYELGEYLTKYCIPGHEYKYALPSKEKTVAIALFSHEDPHLILDVPPPVALFGDNELADKLIYTDNRPYASRKSKRSLCPQRVFKGRDWLEKIMDAYEIALKEAKEKEKYYPGDIYAFNGRILFITQDEFYWKGIGIDEKTVFDDYIKSDQLKAYFDELGLTKELSAGKSNKVPQK